ncbi:ATP-binding protein [Brevundimonas sp. LF-1]|uniref:sensor histidine kinase n=1 Tax=Brevundimonas sp. LF-1 TaxID=3126100 RepID=UPI0030E1F072
MALNAVLPPEPLMIRADRRALKQMTLNLLSNAVKFTPAGGTVTASAQAAGTMLEVIVADTGVGIAKADLARLGRPMSRPAKPTRRRKAAGWGWLSSAP